MNIFNFLMDVFFTLCAAGALVAPAFLALLTSPLWFLLYIVPVAMIGWNFTSK